MVCRAEEKCGKLESFPPQERRTYYGKWDGHQEPDTPKAALRRQGEPRKRATGPRSDYSRRERRPFFPAIVTLCLSSCLAASRRRPQTVMMRPGKDRLPPTSHGRCENGEGCDRGSYSFSNPPFSAEREQRGSLHIRRLLSKVQRLNCLKWRLVTL